MTNNFDTDWESFSPSLYAAQNYSSILPPDREILEKLVDFYSKQKLGGYMLEVGTGPNLYPILAALPYIEKIEVVEISNRNIEYLKKQVADLDDIWKQWIGLLCEINPQVYNLDLDRQLREKVSYKLGSIFDLHPQVYDLASMHFVAESISSEWDEYELACNKFVNSLKHNGAFVATFMEGSRGYTSPGSEFSAVSIRAIDVRKALSPFSNDVICERIKANNGIVREGHTGILFASGHRTA